MREQAKRYYFPLEIAYQAEQDGVERPEFVRRKIATAIATGNPLVEEGDAFVILGIYNLSGKIYPCGSFRSIDDARQRIEELNDAEDTYATHFIINTRGEHIPYPDNSYTIFSREGLPIDSVPARS